MVQNIIIVAEQVAVLFILIAVGFGSGKAGLINEKGAKNLTDIVLYLATPCIMVQSFQNVRYDPALATNLGVAALCAVLIQVASIFVARAVFRNKNIVRRKVLQFGTIFSNCGFMSLPLQQAVIGTHGVFYGAAFVAVFNILVWSYGLVDMSGDKKNFTLKKILLNPGILGAAAATTLFLLRIELPTIALSPISFIAALNTPVPMLVIGYHLSQANLLKAFSDKGVYAVTAMRLVAVPCAALLIMKLCGVSGEILTSCTIASSAPVAATTTMFATKFDKDVELSVGLVSVTTIISIVTMPIIIAAAQSI